MSLRQTRIENNQPFTCLSTSVTVLNIWKFSQQNYLLNREKLCTINTLSRETSKECVILVNLNESFVVVSQRAVKEAMCLDCGKGVQRWICVLEKAVVGPRSRGIIKCLDLEFEGPTQVSGGPQCYSLPLIMIKKYFASSPQTICFLFSITDSSSKRWIFS